MSSIGHLLTKSATRLSTVSPSYTTIRYRPKFATLTSTNSFGSRSSHPWLSVSLGCLPSSGAFAYGMESALEGFLAGLTVKSGSWEASLSCSDGSFWTGFLTSGDSYWLMFIWTSSSPLNSSSFSRLSFSFFWVSKYDTGFLAAPWSFLTLFG